MIIWLGDLETWTLIQSMDMKFEYIDRDVGDIDVAKLRKQTLPMTKGSTPSIEFTHSCVAN